MDSAQDIITSAVSALHSKHLKSLGFKKSSQTWIRTSDRSEVINVQLSQWNTADEAKLTLNFGIHIPELHQALEALPLKGVLKEYDCDVRCRIGRLHTDGQDYWWTVSKATDSEGLADALYAEISVFGLPWFGRLKTYEDIAREFACEKQNFHAAVAYHLAGLPDEANASMVLACSGCNEQAKSRILRIARRLDIQTGG